VLHQRTEANALIRRPAEFHGYVMAWDDLNRVPGAKKALENAGLVTRGGRILP